MNLLTQQVQPDESKTNYTSSKLLTSKVHQFENMPEPKNATEGNFINYILLLIDFLFINKISFFLIIEEQEGMN